MPSPIYRGSRYVGQTGAFSGGGGVASSSRGIAEAISTPVPAPVTTSALVQAPTPVDGTSSTPVHASVAGISSAPVPGANPSNIGVVDTSSRTILASSPMELE